MDSIYINKINRIMKTISLYGTPEDTDGEIKKLKEILSLFEKLTKRKYRELESYSYIPNRNLGRLLFT